MAARIDDDHMTAEFGGRVIAHDGIASMWQMANAARGSYLAGAAVCLLATRRLRPWSPDLGGIHGGIGRQPPGQLVPRLAAWSLGVGIVATVGANLAHGVEHGPVGPLVSARPALALVGSFELLVMLIRTRAWYVGE